MKENIQELKKGSVKTSCWITHSHFINKFGVTYHLWRFNISSRKRFPWIIQYSSLSTINQQRTHCQARNGYEIQKDLFDCMIDGKKKNFNTCGWKMKEKSNTNKQIDRIIHANRNKYFNSMQMESNRLVAYTRGWFCKWRGNIYPRDGRGDASIYIRISWSSTFN